MLRYLVSYLERAMYGRSQDIVGNKRRRHYTQYIQYAFFRFFRKGLASSWFRLGQIVHGTREVVLYIK